MLPFPTFLVDAVPSFAQSHNGTLLSMITPTSLDPPFYYTTRPNLYSWISDRHLSVVAPVLIYWGLSTIFHILDTIELPYFEARRIHESEETKSRNRATILQVIGAVIFQQIVQTIFGLVVLETDESILKTEVNRDHMAGMRQLAPRVADLVFLVLGKSTGMHVLATHGAGLVHWAYWWGVPLLQMFLGL